MGNKLEIAIVSVKDLLIDELQREDFCNARRTGAALETLINKKNTGLVGMPTPPMQGNDCKTSRG